MTDSNGVTWLCHRCARKKDIELDTDPVLLRVCDGCQVENWTRPVKGVVAVIEEVLKEAPTVEPEPEPVIEAETVEAEPEPVVEPKDPYQDMSVEELKAELAKRG